MKFNLATLAASFVLASLVVATPNPMAAVARDEAGDPGRGGDHEHRHHKIRCDSDKYLRECNACTCDDNFVHEGHWADECQRHCDCDASDYHYKFAAM